MYGILNGSFRTINPANGAIIQTLPSPSYDIEGLDYGNGYVYGLVSYSAGRGLLYRYDIAAASWSLVGDTGLTTMNAAGLAYDPGLNVLFAKGSQSTNLYAIDPNTAAATIIGNTGLSAGGGLAYVGSGGNGTHSVVLAPGQVATDRNFGNKDILPPKVKQVLVRGSSWTASILDYLDNQGFGDPSVPHLGYSISAGTEQLKTLPWDDINTISIAFSEDVDVSEADLSLLGVNIPDYVAQVGWVPGSFTYDHTNFVATWTLKQPIKADKLMIVLDGDPGGVTDLSGNLLDGEWHDGTSNFPSGDGSPGGDFTFRFNILPGDADRNGMVISNDVIKVRNSLGTVPGDAGYSIFFDANGDGMVISNDVVKVRNQLSMQLPAGEPALPEAVILVEPSNEITAVSLVDPGVQQADPLPAAPMEANPVDEAPIEALVYGSLTDVYAVVPAQIGINEEPSPVIELEPLTSGSPTDSPLVCNSPISAPVEPAAANFAAKMATPGQELRITGNVVDRALIDFVPEAGSTSNYQVPWLESVGSFVKNRFPLADENTFSPSFSSAAKQRGFELKWDKTALILDQLSEIHNSALEVEEYDKSAVRNESLLQLLDELGIQNKALGSLLINKHNRAHEKLAANFFNS